MSFGDKEKRNQELDEEIGSHLRMAGSFILARFLQSMLCISAGAPSDESRSKRGVAV
jgi:hypothetical protein